MPSIEYVWDTAGNKVYISDAIRGIKYQCPICREQAEVRLGTRRQFFAHKRKSNRTPLEKTCPLYHESTGDKKVTEGYEKDSIQRELFTIYLYSSGDYYELRAYFPVISEESKQYLADKHAEITVSEEGNQCAVYDANEISYFPVNNTGDWFNITCNVDMAPCKDVQVKWLYGFRGLDIEKDIFHSHAEGGYRVANNSNIRIKRKYLFISNQIPKCQGIHFVEKGKISLYNNSKLNNKKNYTVYEMTVLKLSQKTQVFIQAKGYRLIEQDSKLITLWPPVRQTGRSISYIGNEIYLYHKNEGNQRILLSSLKGKPLMDEQQNIVHVKTNSDTLIQFYDQEDIAKLACDLHNAQFAVQKPLFTPIINVKRKDAIYLLCSEGFPFAMHDEIEIQSDIKVDILEKHGFFYSLISHNRTKIKGNDLIAFIPRYHKEILLYKKPISCTSNSMLIMEKDIVYLKQCNGPYVAATYELFKLFELSKNFPDLTKMLETWIKANSVPTSAMKRIYEMLNREGGKV